MTLPNADRAYIPPGKLAGYLLDLDHPAGGPKAVFFHAHGYDAANVEDLRDELLGIAATEPVVERRETPFGTSLAVVGSLDTPRGTTVTVRTVWFLDVGDLRPRFVTAYPE